MSAQRSNECENDQLNPSSVVDTGNSLGCVSRRELLTGMTALAATAMIPAREAVAQGSARPHRIDVHHHYTGANWAPGPVIELMDKAGIATAILSRPGGYAVSQPEQARKMARENNELGAKHARDNPGRFGFFASLPLFDVEGSLREIAYSFDVLKADGACLVTSYETRWVGDPAFAPVFDELNRRKAVVFVHPSVPTVCSKIDLKTSIATEGVTLPMLENQFDTARGVVSLILNGNLTLRPDIRFIFCHGGGAVTTLHERLDHLIGDDLGKRRTDGNSDGSYRSKYVPNGFDNELKKLYLDVVRVANPANLALLTKVMTPDHLLFGSDYPPVPMDETATRLPKVGLDAKLLRAVERDNAQRLFPRFKA